jgi:hypothetical protein
MDAEYLQRENQMSVGSRLLCDIINLLIIIDM